MSKIGASADAAASKVKALQTAINSLKSKTITITANVAGKGSSKLATGTPGALSAFKGYLAGGTPMFGKGKRSNWSGNGGASAGLYMVNDAKGANWRESFMTKDGRMGKFPAIRNLMVHLDEGTQVLNGDDTKRLPRLETGTPGSKAAMMKRSGGNAPIINITVNVNGGGTGGGQDATSLGQKIGNAIGERLRQIMPVGEI